MKKLNFNNSKFIKSVAEPKMLLKNDRYSIVFAGKSNVGKSSVINKIVNRKNFAKVGSTPGKTIHVNYFDIDNIVYFVDLPGYGYAKVSNAEKERWDKLLSGFFSDNSRIDVGLLIIDSRHSPTNGDIIMKELYENSGKPFIVVANKCDKLNKTELKNNPEKLRIELDLSDEVPLIMFSASNGYNKDLLLNTIMRYIK